MSLIIRKPGILTTVQDLGRYGSQRYGINPNGAMDTLSVRAINIALGNDENAAVLEMHFPAPEIEFLSATAFGIAGADLGAEIDDTPILNRSVRNAAGGSVLKFKKRSSGNRSYLAVKGGIYVERWLGSSSTNTTANIGGYYGRPLSADDVLESGETQVLEPFALGPSLASYHDTPAIRIIPSGEFDLLTAISEQTLLSERFVLTNESNRMGFRLKGAPLYLLEHKGLVSSAVNFGTLQLLPDGQLIILMADHQTTGGYPRIGNIISADFSVAGQLGAGDRISFKVVSIQEAERASMDVERDLAFLKTGVSLGHGIVV